MGKNDDIAVKGQAAIKVEASLLRCLIDTPHQCTNHRKIVMVAIRYHNRDIQLFFIYIKPTNVKEDDTS